MATELHSELAIRPGPRDIRPVGAVQQEERRHKHSRSSYSDASPLVSRNSSMNFRPPKRQMITPDKTIAVINASGRQAASFIRVATAVGYHVRAQLRNLEGVVAAEVATNPHVTVIQGELYTKEPQPAKVGQNQGNGHSQVGEVDVTNTGPNSGIGVNYDIIEKLFKGAQLAFINTTFYGDEVKIGQALADAAKKYNVQHYIYSSMPDHHYYNKDWPSLPLWASKHKVEEYIRKLGLPATFVYAGIYNNNFTSLPYPLFCTEMQEDGSFVWQAPFHPDAKLPWLDAEHDVGPAILQIFKDGVKKWGGKRIALAYEMLSPVEACEVFSRGVGRPVRYKRGPIEVKVKIPEGYRCQLEALEQLFTLGGDDPTKQPPYFGDIELEQSCPRVALELWEGPRGLEEYAREVFPLEEQANGLTWMLEDEAKKNIRPPPIIGNGYLSTLAEYHNLYQQNGEIIINPQDPPDSEGEEYEEEEEGLVMRGLKRDDEEWLA